jgi:hypothetical protein
MTNTRATVGTLVASEDADRPKIVQRHSAADAQ